MVNPLLCDQVHPGQAVHHPESHAPLLSDVDADVPRAPEQPLAGVPLPDGAVLLSAPAPLERGRAYIVRITERQPSRELQLSLRAFMESTGVQLLVLGPDTTIEAAPDAG